MLQAQALCRCFTVKLQALLFRRTKLDQKLLWAWLFAALMVACADQEQVQELPINISIDTQLAGSKTEKEFRVAKYAGYEFGLKLGFREGDSNDRQRVLNLAGDSRRDQAGKLIRPGVGIPLRLRLVATNPSDLEQPFEKEFSEQQKTGASETDVYLSISNIRLKPGTYRITVENLKSVPEMRGTPTTVFVARRPKSGAISE